MKVITRNKKYAIYRRNPSITVALTTKDWIDFRIIKKKLADLDLQPGRDFEYFRGSHDGYYNYPHYYGFYDESVVSLILLSR